MKSTYLLLAFICCVSACSDSDDIVKPTPTVTNSPTSVYFKSDLVDGVWRDRYYFFDLNHPDTKDKKFFAAEFMYKNYDTMKIVIEPQSIDNMAANFPSGIMDYPGYGWAANWKNPSFLLKIDDFSGSFYKDPIPLNPASNLYFLNQPEHLGSMAGKWPNAYIGQIRITDGAGGYVKYSDVYFYFNHDLSFSRRSHHPDGNEENPTVDNFSMKSINDMVIGPDYDWETVASAFSSGHSNGNFFPHHYFIDFKKWRYFVWKEGCDNVTGSCMHRTIEYGDYKNLDEMLKWPEGWGKL